jgi:type I restriction enzyme S subunit
MKTDNGPRINGEIENGELKIENWETMKFADIAEITMGQSPDGRFYSEDCVGLPLIQGNSDLENRQQIIRFYTSQVTKICDENDIIMTVRAPVGVIGKTITKSCIGRGVCAIKPKNIEADYLYHLLVFKEKDWQILEQGSTFTSANSIQILNFQLSILNSITHQREIAKILSDMDAEIAALERKREKYRQIKAGAMQVLLTGKLRIESL